MKSFFIIPTLAITFAGCIALPVLNEKYTAAASEAAYYLCQAQKTGTDLEAVTLEDLERIMMRFQNHGGRTPLVSQEEMKLQLQELAQDPVQMGLFIADVSTQSATACE